MTVQMFITMSTKQHYNQCHGQGVFSYLSVQSVFYHHRRYTSRFCDLQQAKKNPKTLFVQKSNSHRDIKIKSVDAADLDANSTFFQEYIGNPLLVDGHKFDIGIYTVMTSMDPLRVYVYWGDVLLRLVRDTEGQR